MALDKARSRLGMDAESDRYPSEGEQGAADLQSVSDPRRIEDETRPTLGKLILKYRYWFLVTSVLAVSILILIAVYAASYATLILTNPWVQRGAAVLFIFVIANLMGRKAYRAKMSSLDELSMFGSFTFDGTLIPGTNDEAPVFKPVKGSRLWGLRTEYYRIGELVNGASNPDDEVKIRLNPSVTNVSYRDSGNVVQTLASDLVLDPYGNQSNVVAVGVETADVETVSEMEIELERQREKKEDAQQNAEMWRMKAEEYRDRMRDSEDEAIESFVDRYSKVAESTAPRIQGLSGVDVSHREKRESYKEDR